MIHVVSHSTGSEFVNALFSWGFLFDKNLKEKLSWCIHTCREVGPSYQKTMLINVRVIQVQLTVKHVCGWFQVENCAGVFVVGNNLTHWKAIRVQSNTFLRRRLSISVELNWCSIAEGSSLQLVVFLDLTSVATTFNLVGISIFSKLEQSSVRNIPN